MASSKESMDVVSTPILSFKAFVLMVSPSGASSFTTESATAIVLFFFGLWDITDVSAIAKMKTNNRKNMTILVLIYLYICCEVMRT